MDTALVLVIGIVAVLGLLVWKFDAVRFGLKGLGLDLTGEGKRGTDAAGSRAAGNKTVQASGDGAAAIGDGAEQANITTDVETAGASRREGEGNASSADVAATGAGSVAVGDGAKGARIKTNVRQAGSNKPADDAG